MAQPKKYGIKNQNGLIIYFNSQEERDQYIADNNDRITPIVNGSEVTIYSPEAKAAILKLIEEENNDPILLGIFEGRYNGRTFAPTPENIAHFTNLYESDKRIKENYGGEAWGKLLGSQVLAAGAAAGLAAAPGAITTAIRTAPQWGPKVMPFVTKHFLAPMAAGEAWDYGSRALTGTTTSELAKNWMLSKGVNETVADIGSGAFNPGYWINFGGYGRYTKPLFSKLGMTASEDIASDYIKSQARSLVPKSRFLTLYVEPVRNYTSNFLKNTSRRINRALPSSIRYWTDSDYKNKVNKTAYLRYTDGIDYNYLLRPIRSEWDRNLKYETNKQKLLEDQLDKTFNLLNLMLNDLVNNVTNGFNENRWIRKYWSGPTTFSEYTGTQKPDYISYTDELGNTTLSDITSVFPSFRTLKLTPELRDSYIHNRFANPQITTSTSYDSYLLSLSDELINAISQRNNRLRTLMGDDGAIVGSSSLMEKGIIAGSPGDDDIITTSTRLPSLMLKLNATKIDDLSGNTGIRVRSNNLKANERNKQEGDLDVIYELNGHAVGKLAHEIYEIFYPNEYKTLRETYRDYASHQEHLADNYFDIDNTISKAELPVSTEQLYLLVKQNPEVKGLMDVLFSHKNKHVNRAFTAVTLPLNSGLVKRLIDAKSTSLYGEPIKLPEGFDLSNIEANKELLRRYGLPEELASNRDVMENISRYLYLSLGSATRGIKIFNLRNNEGTDIAGLKLPADLFKYILSNAHDVTYSPLSGSVSGIGGNFTLGSRGGGTFGDDLSIGLLDVPNEVNNPIKLWNYLSLEKSTISKEQADQINNYFKSIGADLLQISLGALKNISSYDLIAKEGDTYKDVLFNLRGVDSKENNQKLSEILGVNFLKGNEYHNSFNQTAPNYIGIIGDGAFKSRGYTYSQPIDLNLEHGNFKPYEIDKFNSSRKELSLQELTNVIKGFSDFKEKDELLSFVNKLETQFNSNFNLNQKYTDKIDYLNRVRGILRDKIGESKKLEQDINDSYLKSFNAEYDRLRDVNQSYVDNFHKKRLMAKNIEHKANLLKNVSIGTIITASLITPIGIGYKIEHDKQVEETKQFYQWLKEHNYTLDTLFDLLSEKELEEFMNLIK